MITATLRAVRSAARLKLRYREYVLALLTLAFAIQYLDRQVITILAQPIKAEFGLNDAQMGLLSGFVFSIPYSLMLIPVGFLADRRNRRNLLGFALTLWSCLTIVTGFARNVWHLIAIRMSIAAAESINHPTGLSIIADHYDRTSRASAVGVFYAGPAIASIIGFPVVAAIADQYGWRAGFFAAGIPGLLLAVLLFLTVREPRREGSLSPSPAAPPSLRETFAFIKVQRSVLHFMLAMMVTSIVSSGHMMWMVPFLMRGHGLSLTEAALAVSLAFGLSNAAGHLFGGILVDRLARNRMVWYALAPALFALGTLPFIVVSDLVPGTSVAIGCLAGWALIIGFQYGPVMGTVQTLVLPQMRGVTSSCLVLLVNLVGAGLGPLVVGILSDAFSGWAGARSLQVSLACVALLHLWAIAHFLLAARRIEKDIVRVTERLA